MAGGKDNQSWCEAFKQQMDEFEQRNNEYILKLTRDLQNIEIVVKNSANQRSKELDMKLGDLPEFDGTKDPKIYFDWEKRMDRLFEHKGLSDTQRFNFTILKLVGYASNWYENLQVQRLRDGKERIVTWGALKIKMRKCFVPKSYKQKLYLKLNMLQKDNMSVNQYIAEFERLYLACDCKDEEAQKIAKYLIGLNIPLSYSIEVQHPETFDDACMLASTMERHEKEKINKLVRTPQPLRTAPPPNEEVLSLLWKEAHGTSSSDSSAQKNKTLTQGQSVIKGKQCFKCQGHGHIAKQCPNMMMISLEDHQALIMAQQEEARMLSMQDTPTFSFQDMEKLIFESHRIHPLEEDEEPRHVGMIRKVLHVESAPIEEVNQRESLFHTRCNVQGKICSLTVDSSSCTNVVSNELVKELQLTTREHARPYKLKWLDEGSAMKVTKQALVCLSLGDYKDEIWCDLVPMTACHILLGHPWQFDRDVLHRGKSNIYSVKCGDKRLSLAPLPPKVAHKITNKNSNAGLIELKEQILQSKKERLANMLSIWKKPPFEVGDHVFLSLNAQKVFNNSWGKQEPIEEGPFKIVHRENYDTFQVMLGKGVVASMRACDLVPYLEET